MVCALHRCIRGIKKLLAKQLPNRWSQQASWMPATPYNDLKRRFWTGEITRECGRTRLQGCEKLWTNNSCSRQLRCDNTQGRCRRPIDVPLRMESGIWWKRLQQGGISDLALRRCSDAYRYHNWQRKQHTTNRFFMPSPPCKISYP